MVSTSTHFAPSWDFSIDPPRFLFVPYENQKEARPIRSRKVLASFIGPPRKDNTNLAARRMGQSPL